jgi:Ca2+-transporting ATPase
MAVSFGGMMAPVAKSRTPSQGLSAAEVVARQGADGFNELPGQGGRSWIDVLTDVLREPMLALLLLGGVTYFLLGELVDGLLLLLFATISIFITFVQETRTERVLEALRDLTSPRALVMRDGKAQRIAGRDVVAGDLVVLNEGDRVPADALVLEGHDLSADESLLTGESVPVRKRAARDNELLDSRPGGEDLPMVYSGSLVVRGTGLAQVTAIGTLSEIGRIGQSIAALETEPPRLQAQVRQLVFWCALAGATATVAATVLYGVTHGNWLEALLAGIALGMSMLPEEFPVVLTVFMAMGAWRISRARVLTRRAAAIEALGSATVLCTDKTGTLTENRMSIVELRPWQGQAFGESVSAVGGSSKLVELTEAGILASAPDPFDPMEKAFHAFGQHELTGHPDGGTLVRTYGLRPDLLAMTQVWVKSDRPEMIAACKGAPEAVAGLCGLDSAIWQQVKGAVDEMAAKGLRVLGVARARWQGEGCPDSQTAFDFEFLGLVGLADPLRAGVRETIQQCRTAGIRVVMITGDYPATARTIAQAAGLHADDVLTGADLAQLNDVELAERARSVTVFARIMPEQKLRIVKALQADGEIVAMTGDGVNDAPSLKAATIGVAMGGRGTDVAREASSIVLLDDDFGSIFTAVRLGRRIYDNLRKAVSFILAVHVPIAGLALLPLVFGLPIIFSPIHIVFLEMIIDPVCSLVFEAEGEEDDVMARPPRSPDAPLFSARLIASSLVQGGVVLIVVAGIFMFASARAMPDAEVRALAFVSLVLAIVALIFVNRSFGSSLREAFRRPNSSLSWVLGGVGLILTLSLTWPSARDLFAFGPLDIGSLLLAACAGLSVLVVLELVKQPWRGPLGAEC